MTDCCHPFTGTCVSGDNCPVRETQRIEGPACPPCNHDCRQSRSCPARIADELPLSGAEAACFWLVVVVCALVGYYILAHAPWPAHWF